MENYTKKTFDLLPNIGDIEFFKYIDPINKTNGKFITIADLHMQLSTKNMTKFSVRLNPSNSNPFITTEIYNILTTDEYRKVNNPSEFKLIFKFRKKPNITEVKVNADVSEYLSINKFGVKTVGIIF